MCIFRDIVLFCDFVGLSQFLRWITDHDQIEFLWGLWGKWPILRLLLGVCCAKMCIFRDITLFCGFVGLSQFLEVNSMSISH